MAPVEKRTIIQADIEGGPEEARVKRAIDELKGQAASVDFLQTPEVPWFPTKMEDFDLIGRRFLTFGRGIEEIDHPSCKDPEYRKRREYIS